MHLILPHNTYDYFGEPLNVELDDEFDEQSDGRFRFRELDEGVVIMGLDEADKRADEILVIPDEINGRNVVGLRVRAFYMEKSFERIVVPRSVVALGWQALAGVRAVEVAPDNRYFQSVSGSLLSKDGTTLMHFPVDADPNVHRIPSSVKIIGESAFWGNEKIRAFDVPYGIERIDDHAFDGCENLREISIPEGVKTIGENAFNGCASLSKVRLSNSVESIGEYAFCNCYALKRIFIPRGVRRIGILAFSKDIQKIEVDPDNRCFHADANALFNKDQTKLECVFPGKHGRKKYTTPSSVKEIGKHAFTNCSEVWTQRNSLESVELPDGLEIIGDSAFRDCWELERARLPSSIKKIGAYAFSECFKLINLSLPEQLESIGEQAFEECSKMCGDFILPRGVKEIGERAFPVLSNIIVSEGNSYFTSDSYTLYDKNKTRIVHFCHEHDLQTLRIPETTREIDDEIFWGELKLDKIFIPASLEKIGRLTFVGCGAQIEVDQDNPYFSSESGALFNKDKTSLIHFPTKSELKNYVIPDSVVTIEEDAFWECRQLESIEIPASVQHIERHSFFETNAIIYVHQGSYAEKWIDGYQ